MGCEVFGSLRVNFVHQCCVGFILFIVLWNIAHEAFLQLLAFKKTPSDGVEAQSISQVC